MRPTFLRAAIAAGAALFFVGLAPDAQAQSAALVPLKFAYAYPNMENAPLYIAREKGFFRDENLAIEPIALSSGDKITFALLGGSVDIANYTPDWFVRVMEKGESNIKIVFGCSNMPVYSLVVGKTVQSYADLKGARLGVSTIKASDAYLVRKMLAAHGLGEADYVLIQAGATPERAAALRAGSIAGTLLAPPVDERVIDEGEAKRLDVTSSVITHYAWQAQATRVDWARANKPALLGFMRAWIKATRWLYDPANTEETVHILSRELKMDEKYARVAHGMYFGATATIAKDGELDLAGLQELINAMVEQGDLAAPAPKPEKYVDMTSWDEAMTSLK